MKIILNSILIVLLPVSVMAGQAEYDECILKHLKDAKIDVAAHLIMKACKENYKNPTFTSNKKKIMNECLLENLVGVESLPAVMEIKDVCGRQEKIKEK